VTEPEPITVGGLEIRAGTVAQLELPIGRLATGSDMALPVRVVHGARPGPTVWLNAAIHGDEVGGVEIITRLLGTLDPADMAGSVLAVPVVNVHGFIGGDRYLPDRRDLNRSFPGSATGSLAAQIAHLFMTNIVGPSDVGIDLHTASDHRTNLPQVRADLDDPTVLDLATAFAPPALIHARPRPGTLRRAAAKRGKPVLLYEAGEAWRFDEEAIATGVAGVRRVLVHLGVIGAAEAAAVEPIIVRSTTWLRAGRSGILHLDVAAGDRVALRDVLGTIDDAFGNSLAAVRATKDGLVIGHTRSPVVNRGDALVHLGRPAD